MYLVCTVKYIPEGEVFQSAYFTSKWNKERIMLISDSWIYNITVTYFPTRLGQTKVRACVCRPPARMPVCLKIY